MIIINAPTQTSKFLQVSDPAILLIRTFDRKGEWAIEVLFEGGNKVTGSATAEFVGSLESDLADQGWRVDASLFSRGFNAKPPIEELTFVSGIEWADDYGLQEATI